jgi:predicted nucleotidyltransferase
MNYSITKSKLQSVCEKYGICFLGIFGSYARGDFSRNSDLDLLVRFRERKSLLELVRIEREISKLLGMRVDLLTERSISPYLIKAIKKDLRVIYDR